MKIFIFVRKGCCLCETLKNKLTKINGVISSCFLIFYGLIRFIIEYYRQPDAHIGYVAFDSLSMGQILCIPMIVIGIFMFIYLRKTA